MASYNIPDSPALVQFVQVADTLGRTVLIPRVAVDALFGDTDSVTLTLRRPGTESTTTPAVTVSEAAALLMRDAPALEYQTAKAIVSRAARTGAIRSTGDGIARRIDAESLAAWRLARRDKALDAAD